MLAFRLTPSCTWALSSVPLPDALHSRFIPWGTAVHHGCDLKRLTCTHTTPLAAKG